MKDFFGTIGVFILILVLAVVGFCFLDYSGIFWSSKVGVWREDVRRNNFEHTKSYNQGKIQDLAKYFHEYNEADASGKVAIKATVRQMFADYDSSLVPDDELKQFLETCRF
jgi:hypothetical protein